MVAGVRGSLCINAGLEDFKRGAGRWWPDAGGGTHGWQAVCLALEKAIQKDEVQRQLFGAGKESRVEITFQAKEGGPVNSATSLQIVVRTLELSACSAVPCSSVSLAVCSAFTCTPTDSCTSWCKTFKQCV